MEDYKIRNQIANWADILYTRLQNTITRKLMGFTVNSATLYYNSANEHRIMTFEVRETSGANMFTGDFINRICIDVPKGIIDESRPSGLCVAWRAGNSRTEAIDLRKRACYQLAEQFVYKVLPKVDFWIRKEVNNKEIEELLVYSLYDGYMT